MDTNDPENQHVVLRVKGVVKKVFQTSSQAALMGFVGEDLKKKIVITNQLDMPVHIKSIYWDENTDDVLKEKLGTKLEEIEKGRKYAVTFDDKEQIKTGNHSGALVLKTDFEKAKIRKIHVRVTVTAEVMVYPDNLILPEMLIPEGTTRSFSKVIKIVSTRGDSLKILKVVPSRENIVTKVKELKPGKSFRCTLTIRPESKTGKYHEFLTFYTNYTNYKEIKVEIIGKVKVIPADRR